MLPGSVIIVAEACEFFLLIDLFLIVLFFFIFPSSFFCRLSASKLSISSISSWLILSGQSYITSSCLIRSSTTLLTSFLKNYLKFEFDDSGTVTMDLYIFFIQSLLFLSPI